MDGNREGDVEAGEVAIGPGHSAGVLVGDLGTIGDESDGRVHNALAIAVLADRNLGIALSYGVDLNEEKGAVGRIQRIVLRTERHRGWCGAREPGHFGRAG